MIVILCWRSGIFAFLLFRSGAGVSGTLVALYAAMLHIETSGRLPALPAIVLHLWEQRQGLVEEQEQLLLLHRAVAHFANDLLAKSRQCLSVESCIRVQYT